MTVYAWLTRHARCGYLGFELRLRDGRLVCRCGKTKRDPCIEVPHLAQPAVKVPRRSSKPRGTAKRAAARRRRWAADHARWERMEASWGDDVPEDEFSVAGAPFAPKPTGEELEALKRRMRELPPTRRAALREAQAAADDEVLPGQTVDVGEYLRKLAEREGHYPHGAGVVIPPSVDESSPYDSPDT